jgi:LuxR family transcriptional regulator, maltose regulon positive regulatory protein
MRNGIQCNAKSALAAPVLLAIGSDAAAKVCESAGFSPIEIRIRTFGCFQFARCGHVQLSNGKAQQRPLALLKALVAKGGQGASCSLLWERLWPDSDGDLGARNLTITLHRLRHLLGTNATILHHEGKLSLNPMLCWVDVWEFERLASKALQGSPQHANACDWENDLRAALDLYAGHFLASEAEEAWMLEPRIRWKTRFERVVAALSAHYENTHRFAATIDLCLHALEIDPLNEFIYRRLMACYLERGEVASAARVYANCCDALAKGFTTRPSAETERLYRVAMDGKGSCRPRTMAVPAQMSSTIA